MVSTGVKVMSTFVKVGQSWSISIVSQIQRKDEKHFPEEQEVPNRQGFRSRCPRKDRRKKREEKKLRMFGGISTAVKTSPLRLTDQQVCPLLRPQLDEDFGTVLHVATLALPLHESPWQCSPVAEPRERLVQGLSEESWHGYNRRNPNRPINARYPRLFCARRFARFAAGFP